MKRNYRERMIVKRFINGLGLILLITSCNSNLREDNVEIAKVEEPQPVIEEYGFVLDDYDVERYIIEPGDNFGAILGRQGIDAAKIFEITHKVEDTFNPRKIVAGKKYVILKSKDSLSQPTAFIYESNRTDYTVVALGDSIFAYNSSKPVTLKKRIVSGVINSSLSEAIQELEISPLLTYELSNIYQWSIDFFSIQKGDHFKIIYNEKYINDSIFAGIDNIEAAVFYQEDKPYYAFQYQTDSITGATDYYDEEARALRSFFLKAPLDYFRISSSYSGRRFHPVQKRWKAHLGTDYAAPHGTPIRSTANGVVIKASYTAGNGNYVKVKHNDTYTTQYLHMSKIRVKQGQRVKQGDIIGNVGSTGLATGPHVCYRFWVRGKQVDPYRQNLPAAEHIKKELKSKYLLDIEPIKAKLDALEKGENLLL
ncbi:MAG TPA: peptidoglycan DD-metalloendopeptidase family protein [Salinimicrobium sp.]|nr:peptidoglycan DD-metalloendopeptidase family protein [Salinimicrobium sp.]